MLDAVRRYVEAGREALTPKRAEELARDLVEWSRKNSERLRETIGREVSKQIGKAGLATKAEVESLKRRIRKLEASRSTSAKKSSTRKPATRKRTSSSKG
jgi:polyhydroxyalkanoate synthesis regulator phasin